MANALIPRQTVHEWSERIAENLVDHQSSLQRLLKGQRRLTKFVEENGATFAPGTGGVAVYMVGVIARMFDLAGGRLKGATWEQVRSAEARVKGHFDALLPLDDGIGERFRALPRAQAHILDEAFMALFEADRADGEEDIDTVESLKILLLCWVVTEVLDHNWKPPTGFEGESTYTHVHIDPPVRPDDSADASDGVAG